MSTLTNQNATENVDSLQTNLLQIWSQHKVWLRRNHFFLEFYFKSHPLIYMHVTCTKINRVHHWVMWSLYKTLTQTQIFKHTNLMTFVPDASSIGTSVLCTHQWWNNIETRHKFMSCQQKCVVQLHNLTYTCM